LARTDESDAEYFLFLRNEYKKETKMTWSLKVKGGDLGCC